MKFWLGLAVIASGLVLKYIDDTTASLDTLDAMLPNGLDVPTAVILAGAGIFAWEAYGG